MQRGWLLLGAVVAGLATASQFGTLRLLPPSFHGKSPTYATANTSVLLSPSTGVRNGSDSYEMGKALDAHTLALGEILGSPMLRASIAADARVPASQLAIDAPLWTQLQRVQIWDTGPKRSVQILVEHVPYRLTLTDGLSQPIIYVTAQGPTAGGAAHLAAAVTTALSRVVTRAQDSTHIPAADRYEVAQLAPIVVSAGKLTQELNLALLVFLSVFVVWTGVVLAVARLRDDLRLASSNAEHGATHTKDRPARSRWSVRKRRRRIVDRTGTADVW